MKGDASVCHTSHFLINARHATMSLTPFSIKCETCLYYACFPYEEKGDVCNRGASRIRSPCPKISGPVLSLATLSNFLKPPSALALLSPWTLSHCCRLSSSSPALEHAVASSLALELTTASSLASEHAAASSPILLVALSSTSTSQLPWQRHHHPPLALDAAACPSSLGLFVMCNADWWCVLMLWF
jgi:hypothetical protein